MLAVVLPTLLTGEPSVSFRSLKTSLLSWYLALEALLIGVHCKKRYRNVWIQYNIWILHIVYQS